ncbi:MAG: pyridoxal 5'-phosphate synthase lyase subunit PdxS, partial [Candidatus Bathyarchaeota archaeon]
IDESEVLTPADQNNHIEKKKFTVPFVCGARNLGEALRRINEGASMIRTKGEAGTGNIVEAVKHIRSIKDEIVALKSMDDSQLKQKAAEYRIPIDLLKEVRDLGRLPVVNFAAGGIASPSDAALCMQLGCDGVFVGSGIFKSSQPEVMAKAIVEAVSHFKDAKKIAEVSSGLGEAMKGLDVATMKEEDKLSVRGV